MGTIKHDNKLTSNDIFDIHTLMFMINVLKDSERLIGTPVFDIQSYTKFRRSVTRLYDDICRRVPNALPFLQEIKTLIPQLDEGEN